MEKILITSRDPGPMQAMVSIASKLKKHFRVYMLVSDVAESLAQNEYKQQLKGIYLLFWSKLQKEFLNKVYIQKEKTLFASVFSSQNETGYIFLIKMLKELIREIAPDKIIRTTPAYGYGIDEAIVKAAHFLGYSNRCFCYQESYFCGNALTELAHPIATVDIHAQKQLQNAGIDSVPIGWINALRFSNSKSYTENRIATRRKMKIADEDIIVLYCVTASGNINAELLHFEQFLSYVNHKTIYLKFHPRTSRAERKKYFALAKEKHVVSVDTFNMEEVLSFSDYIISAASMINIDSILYQLHSGENTFRTISVFTEGKTTEEIIDTVCKDNHLSFLPYVGSVLTSEKDYKFLGNKDENVYKNMYEQACKFFNINEEAIFNRFCHYLETEKKEDI